MHVAGAVFYRPAYPRFSNLPTHCVAGVPQLTFPGTVGQDVSRRAQPTADRNGLPRFGDAAVDDAVQAQAAGCG